MTATILLIVVALFSISSERLCKYNEIYLLKQDKCIQRDWLCKYYNTKGQCQACFFKYFPRNHFCINDVNCALQYRGTALYRKCLKCAPLYFLYKGKKCIPFPKNCQNYNQLTNKCQKCLKNSKLITGECMQANLNSTIEYCEDYRLNSCLRCQADYKYDEWLRICINNTQLCFGYSTAKEQCTVCYEPYLLNRATGECQIIKMSCKQYGSLGCTDCYGGYYLTGNKCLTLKQSCNDYKMEGGDCLSCFDGYSLFKGKCIRTDRDPCQSREANNKSLCTKCVCGFYLQNNTCNPNYPNCPANDPQNGRCTLCYIGDYLTQTGHCQQLIFDSKCMKYDQNHQCLQCWPWAKKNKNGLCLNKDPYCKTFKTTNFTCHSCLKGFHIQNNKCVSDV